MRRIILALVFLLGVVACGDLQLGNDAPKFADVSPGQQVDAQQPKTTGPAQPDVEKVVVELSGEGAKTTRPFTVSDGWEIRWTLKSGQYGQLMQVFLNNADGSPAFHNVVPINAQAAGPGSTYVSQGGSYTLQVNAMGSWTMKVVDLP